MGRIPDKYIKSTQSTRTATRQSFRHRASLSPIVQQTSLSGILASSEGWAVFYRQPKLPARLECAKSVAACSTQERPLLLHQLPERDIAPIPKLPGFLDAAWQRSGISGCCHSPISDQASQQILNQMTSTLTSLAFSNLSRVCPLFTATNNAKALCDPNSAQALLNVSTIDSECSRPGFLLARECMVPARSLAP